MKTRDHTEVENFLYSTRNLQFTINEMKKTIELYKRDISGLKAVDYSKSKISGGGVHDVGDTVEKVEHTITKMLYDQLAALNRLMVMRMATQEIAALLHEDKTMQGLIVARYVNCRSWADIAHDLNYGIDNVYKIHRKAIQILNDEYQDRVRAIIKEADETYPAKYLQ